MIKNVKITSTDVSVPQKVYTSSVTGEPVGAGGGAPLGQVNAITTMILCNTGTPTILIT